MSVGRRIGISVTALTLAVAAVVAASRSQAPAAEPARRAVAEAAATMDGWVASIGGSRLVAVLRQESLDLRHVAAAPGDQVVVNVFVTLGRARVRVPEGWAVNTSAVPLLGSIDQDRAGAPGHSAVQRPGTPPRLLLRGFILFGRVEVTS